jgi:hypothetical protein
MLSARSLLVRTAGTIALALLLFVLISLGTAAYFVAIPIAKRSADDLAALMIITAQTWHEASTGDQTGLRKKLLLDHGLSVAMQTPVLPEKTISLPYLYFLRDALARRTGEEIAVLETRGGGLLWVDIPARHWRSHLVNPPHEFCHSAACCRATGSSVFSRTGARPGQLACASCGKRTGRTGSIGARL